MVQSGTRASPEQGEAALTSAHPDFMLGRGCGFLGEGENAPRTRRPHGNCCQKLLLCARPQAEREGFIFLHVCPRTPGPAFAFILAASSVKNRLPVTGVAIVRPRWPTRSVLPRRLQTAVSTGFFYYESEQMQ